MRNILLVVSLTYASNIGWTWMGGTQVGLSAPVIGTRFQFSPTNTPDCINEATSFYSQKEELFFLYGAYCWGPSDGFWVFNRTSRHWAWFGGQNQVNQPAQFGLKGISDSSVYPGSLSDSFLAYDESDRKLYLFGGSTNLDGDVMSDLFVFSMDLLSWAWVGGPGTANAVASYADGSRNKYQAGVWPGAREGGAYAWDQTTRRFFISHGYGLAGTTSRGFLADTWSFRADLSLWAWHNGGQLRNQLANYGKSGTYAVTNIPGARLFTGSYFDPKQRRFFMFGGYGYTASGGGDLNDLWEYDVDMYQWKFVGGGKTILKTPYYGKLLVASPNNLISGRWWPMLSFDPFRDRLYVYGGYQNVAQGEDYKIYNDFWEFSFNTSMWRWISGSQKFNQPPRYGRQGVWALSNSPGARMKAAGFFEINDRQLWMIGGLGVDQGGNMAYLNDIWRFQTPFLSTDDFGRDNSSTVSTDTVETAIVYTQPSIVQGKRTEGTGITSAVLTNPGVIIGLLVAIILIGGALLWLCIKSASRKNVADAVVIDPGTTMMGAGATFMSPGFSNTFMGAPASNTFMGMPGSTFMGMPPSGTFMGYAPHGSAHGMVPIGSRELLKSSTAGSENMLMKSPTSQDFIKSNASQDFTSGGEKSRDDLLKG